LICKKFTKTIEAFTYLEKNPVDLLFLDINMPSVSGIEFYKSIPQKTMVIFTTSYSEYAIESYNLNAVDYLLKPYTAARFLQAAEKVKEKYIFLHPDTIASKEQFLMLRADYGLVKVTLSDILFIEGLDNYLKIHLQNQKPLVIRITMKALLEQLPEKEFIRVHRSYIIAANRIETFRNKIITIAGEEIPVGNSYEENLTTLFKK
jgi:DNA-binding LytR/AlgR family response regulator